VHDTASIAEQLHRSIIRRNRSCSASDFTFCYTFHCRVLCLSVCRRYVCYNRVLCI